MALNLQRRVPASIGLWVGALAWATSTQLNYSLVPWTCASGVRLTPWIAAVLALLSLWGAWLSWRSLSRSGLEVQTEDPAAGTPFDMLAAIGAGAGVLFAAVIVMQGVAAFFLTGCEP